MQTGSYLLRSWQKLRAPPRQTHARVGVLRSLNANGREGRAPPHDAWSDRPAGPWPPGPSRIAWELSLPPGTGSGRSLHAELRRPAGHCPGTHTDMSYGACSVSGTPGRLHAECQSGRTRRRCPASRSIRRALTVSGACTAWPTASSRQGHDRQRGAMPPAVAPNVCGWRIRDFATTERDGRSWPRPAL